MVSFFIPLHHHLLATGRYVTMLPQSMLRFGKHLPLRSLRRYSAENYPTGIVTFKNRTLGPLAQLFIEEASKLAVPFRKGG